MGDAYPWRRRILALSPFPGLATEEADNTRPANAALLAQRLSGASTGRTRKRTGECALFYSRSRNPMTVLRSDIERALRDLASNEEGMRFQGLAVVLAKKRWPELIASERKSDLGADAIAKTAFAAEGTGKVLACSITPKLSKVRQDAEKIKAHFPHIKNLIFATPAIVSAKTAEAWATAIRKEFGYELAMMSREDIITSLLDPSNASLLQGHLGIHIDIEPTLAQLAEQVRRAAAEVADAWSKRIQDTPLIDLRLIRLESDGRDTSKVLGLHEIREALDRGRRIVLEGPAGRGKTTTLIQLARSTTTGGTRLLVDLPAWTASRAGIFEYFAGMPQFQTHSLDAKALARVGTVEHYSFLLNGWNEVGETESHYAEIALKGLERDFPTVGILVATRTHHIVPPLPGALRARLLKITRADRAWYLRARLAGRAEELRLRLDNDPVLDDLTRTPFFLSEVTGIFQAGQPIPPTKIGVLEAVMGLVERSVEHRNHLRDAPLIGRAGEYLGELATRMTAHGAATISENEALSAANFVGTRLKDAGQLAASPEPAAVLNALCAHHILERQEYPLVSFRFEHQQFQEFYAAIRVRKQLASLLQQRDEAKKLEFTRLIVNEPAWAEPLGMIADDIRPRAEASGGHDAVGSGKLLVTMALQVDPVFAAELARVCGPLVWREVRAQVGDRLRSLSAVPNPHYKHLALAGMLATGSDDFKDVITPLLSDDDQQKRLGAYRTWSVRLSSLGPNWRDTVSSWKEEVRVDFISEILQQRYVPEIASFAHSDPSMKVREAAIVGLSWRGAAEEAAQIVETVDASTMEGISRSVDIRLFSGSARDRVLGALQGVLESTMGCFRRLLLLAWQSELGVTSISQLKDALGEIPEGFDGRRVEYSALKPILDIVRASDPKWVSAWVTDQILKGARYDESLLKFVTSVPDAIKARMIERLEGEDFKNSQPRIIMDVLVAGADTALAQRAFLKLCEVRRIITAAPKERHDFEWAVERQLEALLRAMPVRIAFTGFFQCFEATADHVQLDVITRVFSNMGRSETDPLDDLDGEMREKLRLYLKSAIPAVVQDAGCTGELMGHVASVLASVGVLADTADLRQLIRADIARFNRAQAARARGDRTHLGNATSYAMWHVRAVMHLDPVHWDSVLLDFLDDPVYEHAICEEIARFFALPIPGLIQKPDYEKVWAARLGIRNDCQSACRIHCTLAIRSRIEVLLEQSSQSNQKRPYEFRLRTLTVALAACDSHGSADLVFEVMSIPDEWSIWPRIAAIESLLSNGVALPTGKTLSILDSCLDRRYGFQQQDVWLFGRLLCLLPFVDDPARGIQKVRELMSQSRVSDDQLLAVFEAVGHSRCAAALPFLREIAANKPLRGYLGEAWINAVAAVDTAESRDVLLSFLDPQLSGLPVQLELDRGDALVNRIVEFMRREPAVEQGVFQLCHLDLTAPKRFILAQVVGRFGTLQAVSAGLELLDDTANPPIPYEIREQIEAAFVESRPYPGKENTYTLVPQSSNAIRAKLLEMASKDKRRKNSAFQLLAQIEEWRLEYGRPAGEPRHPALDSAEPWPFIPTCVAS